MRLENKEVLKLIQGIQKGDRTSGKKLYESFAMYVLTICKRYYVDSELLKDYLQDIFSECFSSLKRYDSEKGEFKFWLRRIAINYILKKKNKNSIIEHSIEVELLTHSVSADPINTLNLQDLLHLLSNMPQKFAVVFNMFVIDGYSNKEISEILDLNENTVRSYIKRGRDWAKAAIESNYSTT